MGNNQKTTKPAAAESVIPPAQVARAMGGAAEIAAAIENDDRLHKANVSVREMLTLHPRARVLMVAEAIRGLDAVVQCWSASRQEYVEKVDHATRLKSVAWLASYSDGLPVQRNENFSVTASAKPSVDYETMLRKSPALAER